MNEWELRVDKVLHGNVHSFIFGGMPANWGVAINAIQENPNCAPEQRWWLEVIQDVIFGIASGQHPQYQFCRNPRYDASLDAAYERFNLARTEAVTGLGHWLRLSSRREPCRHARSSRCIGAARESTRSSRSRKSSSRHKALLAARQRKINEMTSNGTKNFSVRTGNINSIRYDVQGFEIQFIPAADSRRAGKGFEGMTDEEIETIYRQVGD